MNLNLVSTESALLQLVSAKTKRVLAVTWTLAPSTAMLLQRIHDETGVELKVIYAKLLGNAKNVYGLSTKHFRLMPHCHIKLWIIDDIAYVGSANIVPESVLDVMYRITQQESLAKVESFFLQLWAGHHDHRHNVHFL